MTEEKIAAKNAEENARIAKLTSDAIKASNEKVVEDIKRTIEAVEEQTTQLRLEADNLVEQMRLHTGAFADRVTAFVENCHGVALMVKDHQKRLEQMPNGAIDFNEVDTLSVKDEVVLLKQLAKNPNGNGTVQTN